MLNNGKNIISVWKFIIRKNVIPHIVIKYDKNNPIAASNTNFSACKIFVCIFIPHSFLNSTYANTGWQRRIIINNISN